jgi:NADPH:quinone reductase-like Zn-dependent oxidoreductase
VNGAGGVTGGLLVQLAAARGARVIATASAKKAERIRGYGASEVLDYHGEWPALVREITGGGAASAVNAARGQAATTLRAVADDGRLATITGDPPQEQRGVAVSDVYVRPDGRQLSALAELLARGTLSVPIASVRPLEEAGQALREAVEGVDGAIVLSLRA